MNQKKGTIAVRSIKNRLRLQWSWAKSKGGTGERFSFTLELDDDPVNRRQAELKAALIQRDIESGHFDPTLSKYRPNGFKKNGEILYLKDLFNKFIQFKKISLRETSLEKYFALNKHIEQFFGERLSDQVSTHDCTQFRDWLLTKQQPSTTYERLVLLSAAFDWAIDEKLLATNPCKIVARSMDVPRSDDPQPFEADEALKIIEAFVQDPEYAYYSDLVIFLFNVGCRFGEASALQWKHLSRDCSEITIREAIDRKKNRKSTKNGLIRHFGITPELQQILLDRRPPNYSPDDLVFPSRRSGSTISDRTFNDVWTSVLSRTTVAYKPPQKTRCTFVSLSLMDGQNPLEVCEITGHDRETMFEYYARFVGKPKARSLYLRRF